MNIAPGDMLMGNPQCGKCAQRHTMTWDCEAAKERQFEALRSASQTATPPRKKATHVGAPACFVLERECQFLCRAFDGQAYLVGSAMERPDWRDIDVRMIMDDEAFVALFPDAGPVAHGHWEFDPRWIVLTTAISEQLSRQTGLPVDFQFQPRTSANERHGKGKGTMRNALGLVFSKGTGESE